jgi:hypothetical protein
MEKSGYLVVKARTAPTLWDQFNEWYVREHQPVAAKRLGATEAFRLHSRDEPHTHIAVYRFDDMDVIETPAFQAAVASLVREFNEQWPTGVERTRMFFSLQDVASLA